MRDYFTLLVILLIVAAVIIAISFYMTGGKKEENNTGLSISTRAIITTNMGEIELELFEKEVPATVDNFATLSTAGFYNGTKFHRVIKGFMIQGGDPLSKEDDRTVYGFGGPGYTFNDEPSSTPLVKGIVAMANSGPNTNGSQFFIVTAEATPWLQGKHTPFAKVVRGMDIVEQIENVATDERDIPVEDIVVEKIEIF
jgi:cyclophilin family peptidyl-prolyl cis-trans isomerase